MFRNILEGYLTIEISDGDCPRFLNICAYRNIDLWQVETGENELCTKLRVKDFFQLKPILRKTGCRLKIKKKSGLPFFLKKLVRRKLYYFSPLLGLFLLWMLSRFLWSVEIEGNLSLTNDMLQDFLTKQGVHYGMPLSRVPLHEIKTNLRQEYEEITWVSARLEGTVLIISLKENDVTVRDTGTSKENMGNLTAHQDGIVESILVRAGSPMVKAGDEVKKGDILIAGKYEIPDMSDGTVKREEYLLADGDVWLTYSLPINKKLDFIHETKEYTGRSLEKYSMEWLGKNWGFDLRKIPFVTYDLTEERRQLSLPGNVPMTAFINRKTYREYVIAVKKYSKDEAGKLLSQEFEKIISTLEEKGVQIIEKNVKIESNSVSAYMSGTLTVRELCREISDLEEINDHR